MIAPFLSKERSDALSRIFEIIAKDSAISERFGLEGTDDEFILRQHSLAAVASEVVIFKTWKVTSSSAEAFWQWRPSYNLTTEA